MTDTSQIHLALLRGINVGGKNKVDMARLRATFESLGHEDVTTYINSGNVIFRSGSAVTQLRSDVEDSIADVFGLDLMVLIRDLPGMDAVDDELPAGWVHDTTAKTNVMFLDDPVDGPEIVDELGGKDGIDDVRYAPGAILWHTDAENWTRSGAMKLAGTAIYRQMTVRNVNTFRKLHQLMRAAAG